jgi:2-polyprenyl-3-methyl-5-hydroxy-6-metoxy-1,4-benzoquinol methylase
MANDRQTAVNLGGIRVDHINRYTFALNMARSPILDAACGVGYGSYILAEHGHNVTAVDIAPEAISFGRTYYGNGNIHWITGDLTEAPWGWEKFKTIVSFETIEHLSNPGLALKHFHDSLDDDGKLFCSVPNEELMPFKPQNFEGDQYPHLRHYTPAQFEELLSKAGFEVIYRGHQKTKTSVVQMGSGGIFLVYVAIKRSWG